jgi:3',5'-cyclic AMP phosphodiesterase CpdA
VAGARRILVVSDTHLSPRTPEADANWAAVVALVARGGFELVVHVGDLTLDAIAEPGELARARQRLDALAVPWVAVPGNHDVGDNPGVSPGPETNASRIEPWVAAIGPDRWEVAVDGWTVLGVNAQLFGSDSAGESAQWAWLEDTLGSQPSTRPIVFVCHKPLSAAADEIATAPRHRFVPARARQRLQTQLEGRRVSVVVSGHVHQFRVLERERRHHVWAPTTWAVLPDDTQQTLGLKQCGVVALELGPDGVVHDELLCPPGMAQLTLSVDIPDPYLH